MNKNDAEYYYGIGKGIVPEGIFERFPELIPAVGESYYDCKGKHKKLLIIAESNYLPEVPEEESVFKDANKWYTGKNVALIPETIKDYFSNWKINNFGKGNMSKIIGEVLTENHITHQDIGHEIAFYNYFLRPALNTGKGSYKNIEPEKIDYDVAGVALKEIISKLEPEVIVFASAKAYNAFTKYIDNDIPKSCSIHKVSHPSCAWWNRNGGAYGREKFKKILNDHYIIK